MPWEEVSIMSSRLEFVHLASQPGANRAQLCRRFGVSRKTGYKLLRRYVLEGVSGLAERPRRPQRSPKRTEPSMEAQVVRLRKQTHWGGRKIARRLRTLGLQDVPTASTVTGILRRHGLIEACDSAKHQPYKRFEHPHPNDLWQMDFKGHFPLAHQRCHPLTVLDDHSRYCVALRACENERADTVQSCLTHTFERHGLPERMLMDNGSPWGSDAQHPMTVLTVWLIRLGIGVSHGRPYHPQTQGKDERFHRSLQYELLRYERFQNFSHCQRRFDEWRELYNFERPHESLKMQVPADRYRASTRNLPAVLAPIEYAPDDEVRIVHDKGIDFRGRQFRICKALRGYSVALRPTATDGQWQVYFCHQLVATLDLRTPSE